MNCMSDCQRAEALHLPQFLRSPTGPRIVHHRVRLGIDQGQCMQLVELHAHAVPAFSLECAGGEGIPRQRVPLESNLRGL